MFYIGAIVGSFILNYLTHLYKPFNKYSCCDHCQKRLSWFQLIPIFSYLFLRGRCYKCKQVISINYLVIEILFGCLFILIEWLSSDLFKLQINILFLLMFLMVSMTDIKQGIIEDEHLMILLIMIVMIKIMNNEPIDFIQVIKVICLLVLFSLSYYIYTKKEGIGHGDIKLITCLSFVFSFEYICLIILGASFLGLIYGLMYKQTQIRFGPFICFTVMLVSLFY